METGRSVGAPVPGPQPVGGELVSGLTGKSHLATWIQHWLNPMDSVNR